MYRCCLFLRLFYLILELFWWCKCNRGCKIAPKKGQRSVHPQVLLCEIRYIIHLWKTLVWPHHSPRRSFVSIKQMLYICMLGVSMLPVSTSILLDFRIVPTMSYYKFIISLYIFCHLMIFVATSWWWYAYISRFYLSLPVCLHQSFVVIFIRYVCFNMHFFLLICLWFIYQNVSNS